VIYECPLPVAPTAQASVCHFEMYSASIWEPPTPIGFRPLGHCELNITIPPGRNATEYIIERLDDCRVFWPCQYVYGNLTYRRSSLPGPPPSWDYFNRPIPYDSVILICGCSTSYNYFHFTHDFLMPSLWIPEPLRSTALFVIEVSCFGPFICQSLEFFGLAGRVVSVPALKSRGFLLARHLYRFNPQTLGCSRPEPAVLLRFRSEMVRRLDLDREPATKYCLMNRKPKGSRWISNWDEIVSYCNSTYPSLGWQTVTSTSNIQVNAKLWNVVLFFMCPHGAGTTNVIYMQRGSVLCEIESERGYCLYPIMAASIGIHSVFARLDSMPHHKWTRNVFPLNRTIPMVTKGLQYLRKG